MGVITRQIGNAFACRTEKASIFFEQGLRAGLRWLASNRFLLVGIAVELLLINILVYVSPFQTLFEHGPIAPLWWFLIIWYAPALFLLEEGRKAVIRWLDRQRALKVSTPPSKVEASLVTEGKEL
jgi:glucose-6-phosphate-specific signal transduction histidine kinase